MKLSTLAQGSHLETVLPQAGDKTSEPRYLRRYGLSE